MYAGLKKRATCNTYTKKGRNNETNKCSSLGDQSVIWPEKYFIISNPNNEKIEVFERSI
jgi:hypothetical protein